MSENDDFECSKYANGKIMHPNLNLVNVVCLADASLAIEVVKWSEVSELKPIIGLLNAHKYT